MNIKLNFILISDQLHQFHMRRKPKINNKLINLTLIFIFFDAIIQEERPRTHPLTATEGREGLNAGIPESKALFVVSKGE